MADESTDNSSDAGFNQWLYSLYQQQKNSGAGSSNTAGKGDETAANIFGTVGQLGGLANLAIPGLGTAISAGSSLISGLFENAAANKQKQQAANLRQQAQNAVAPPLPPEFQQHVTADEMAAQGDMPGLETAKNSLMTNFVAHMRAIRESSPNGAHAVNAISESLGLENEALNKLMAENADFKTKEGQKFRDDLWNLGLMKHQNQQEFFNEVQKPMYEQATALENASTANKQTAVNTIAGSIGTAGTEFSNQWAKADQSQKFMQLLKNMYGGTGGDKTGVSTGDANAPYLPYTGQTTGVDKSLVTAPTGLPGQQQINVASDNPSNYLWNMAAFYNTPFTAASLGQH